MVRVSGLRGTLKEDLNLFLLHLVRSRGEIQKAARVK